MSTQTFCSPRFFLLACFSFIFFTCKKDDSPLPNPYNGDVETVNAGVAGTVLNEKGLPVEGAQVTAGNSSTTTDRLGFFRLENVTLSKNNGCVKVAKSGYFKAYRNFVTTQGKLHQVRIRLLPETNAGSISATGGGSVSLTDGAKLTLPANAVTDLSNNPYNGAVNVAMTWINPTDPNLSDIVMGDLRGITTGGEERGLQTYGMIGVELRGTGGQELKIKNGQKAELIFPIPTAITNAPASIDLWHYDETKQRWIQEGSAVKSGSTYKATVSHFSFWNCDAPFPLVDFCVRIVDEQSSKPLNNIGIRIIRPNGIAGYGRTDTSGNVCGKIPKNETLTLEVLDQCNQVIATKNIGSLSSNTDLGIIKVTVPALNKVVITGTVKNCTNQPLTNGAAVVYAGSGQTYTANINNGVYEIVIIKCTTQPVNYSVYAVDLTNKIQSVSISVNATSGNITVPDIQVCNGILLPYIEMMIDNEVVNFVSPPDEVYIGDSSINNTIPDSAYIVGSKRSNTGSTTGFQRISFLFEHSRIPQTGLPLRSCSVFFNQPLFSSQILTPNPTVNLTAFSSASGGIVEGNFNIDMNFQGTSRRVKCNFRVKQR
jgi:hypothetical protein